MTDERNNLIEPENYYEGYNESARKLAASQEQDVSLDELCFRVLGVSEDGKKLLEMFKQRYIYPSVPCPLGANYESAAVYYEGLREGFRQVISMVEGFKLRKDYEAKQAELNKEGSV